MQQKRKRVTLGIVIYLCRGFIQWGKHKLENSSAEHFTEAEHFQDLSYLVSCCFLQRIINWELLYQIAVQNQFAGSIAWSSKLQQILNIESSSIMQQKRERVLRKNTKFLSILWEKKHKSSYWWTCGVCVCKWFQQDRFAVDAAALAQEYIVAKHATQLLMLLQCSCNQVLHHLLLFIMIMMMTILVTTCSSWSPGIS